MKGLFIGLLCAAGVMCVSAAKPITVALIGYGADIEHPALRGAIWTNPKEKPNGVDDDRNGWVDDLHGWNFLGELETLSRESEREYLRLREKYGNYFAVVDGKAYKFDDTSDRILETPLPEDMTEFNYFLLVKSESEIAQAYGGLRLARAVVKYMDMVDAELRALYPDREITIDDFNVWIRSRRDTSTEIERNMNDLIALMSLSAGSQEWSAMREYGTRRFVNDQHEAYLRILRTRLPKEHETLGDDQYDLADKGYGSGDLLSENAPFGTMQAGIIAARDNDHVQGIAPEAKIMFLRVDAGERNESRVKDVALAIRYAVDKGARVIQLGRSNTIYPYPFAAWVDEALRYAETKGVVVVQPMLDLAFDLDETQFYPRKELPDGHVLSNMITVAAADGEGNPWRWANFSPRQLDMFALGVDVESTSADGAYAAGSGSYLAAARVTGAVALLRQKYPKLTPAQVREVLMSSVKAPASPEVEKTFFLGGKLVTDLFLFDELSVAHGSLDVAAAMAKAAKL